MLNKRLCSKQNLTVLWQSLIGVHPEGPWYLHDEGTPAERTVQVRCLQRASFFLFHFPSSRSSPAGALTVSYKMSNLIFLGVSFGRMHFFDMCNMDGPGSNTGGFVLSWSST